MVDNKKKKEIISSKRNISHYNASNIEKLEGLEGVRKRPDMYIGDTNERGLHHCVFEIVDNSIDEALAGYCNVITVTIHLNGSISIKDNGRGIPVDEHSRYKIPALELVMTNLHAGGKFEKGAYMVSGGLHGVGAKCVNALSKKFEVEVLRDGKIHYMKFSKGKTIEKIKIIGKTNKNGTKITFLPDPSIFTTTQKFKYEILKKRLRELAFLNPNIEINLIDEISNKKNLFKFKKGIVEYVEYLNKNRNILHKPPIAYTGSMLTESGKLNLQIFVDIALQYNDSYHNEIHVYANSICNIEGGTHLSGFRTALTRSINKYAKANNLFKDKDPGISGEDVREGLVAIVSVKVPEPRFEGQTKTKLSNGEVDGVVQKITGENLKLFFEKNPNIIRKLIEKFLAAARAREAARKAKETVRKNVISTSGLPGKLADCSEKAPELCELFIVEGVSAGGSAKQGRDRRFQAILPIRGKLLNVEKARLDKILNNTEIRSLITAIGTGIGNIGEGAFDIKKLRYHKIIIMTDADVDGSHIDTLLLTFIFRKMEELIKNGYIYVAQPPLYRITKRKQEQYIENELELNKILLQLGSKEIILTRLSDNYKFSKVQINKIIKYLFNLEVLITKMSQLKYSLHQYLSYYANLFKLPKYIVKIKIGNEEKYQFLIDEEEKLKFYSSLGINKVSCERKIIQKKFQKGHWVQCRIEVNEVHERQKILNILQNLDKIGIVINYPISKKIYYYQIQANINDKNKNIIKFNSILEIIKTIRSIGKRGLNIQRYKGLGEMNPKQLYETTMNPKKRKLLKINIEDVVKADKTFTMLMGENVALRRMFIENNALNTSCLDV